MKTTSNRQFAPLRAIHNGKPNLGLSTIHLALAAAAACALLTGCQVLTYRSATGERFTRSSLGSNLAISSLTVSADTNGVRSVSLQGYQNDSTQALGTVTDAAVKAAIAAAKP